MDIGAYTINLWLAIFLGLLLLALGGAIGFHFGKSRPHRNLVLRQSNNAYDLFAVINRSNVGYAISDKAGHFIYASHGFLKMANLPPLDQIINKVWFTLDEASDGLKARRAAEWHAAMKENTDWSGIVRWINGPNDKRFFETTLKRMGPDRVAFIIQDRTAQIEARRNMEAQENLTHFVLNNVPVIVTLQKPDGTFLFATENLAQRLGISVEDIVGNKPEGFVPYVRFKKLESLLKTVVQSRQSIHGIPIEFTYGPLKGVHWSLFLSPLFDDKDEIDRILIVALDVTEQVKIQKERQAYADKLSELQKIESLNRFAAGLAHELGNILHPVGVYARALTKNPEMEGREQYFKRINDAVMAAGELLQQTSDMARPYSQPTGLTDITAMVREMVAFVNGLTRRKQKISLKIPEDPVFANVSETGIRQVLLNLINNALDATQDGGEIIVQLKTGFAPEVLPQQPSAINAPHLCLEVCDTGVGMSEETKQQIFDTFFTTKKDRKGTGLGLAFVRNLVSSWDGDVSVETALGAGSVFKIWLPEAENVSQTLSGGQSPLEAQSEKHYG